MACPTKYGVLYSLHEDFSLDWLVCYSSLLYLTGTNVFFICNLISWAPSPSFSLLAALIADFYLQSHRGHLWCQQQSSCWEKKYLKIQKNRQLALSLQKKCEDRLPTNSARWKSVLQWQGLTALILHVTSFPVHPNFLLDHPFCSMEWTWTPPHSMGRAGGQGNMAVVPSWDCVTLLVMSFLSSLLLYRCH